jgi:hypothetical protein
VGLSLEEVTQLLAGADNGESAEVLRQLAERRLPDIEALIERAQAMKAWLELAAECRCASLDVCDLFADDVARRAGPFSPRRSRPVAPRNRFAPASTAEFRRQP